MSRVTIDDTLLKNMANAIRTKDGSTELFGVDTFENKILNIPSGVEFENIILGEITIPSTVFSITVDVGVPDDYNILGFYIFSKTFVKEYLATGKDPKEYKYKSVGGACFMSYDGTVALHKIFISHTNDGFVDPMYSYRNHNIDNVNKTFTFNARTSSNYPIVGDYFYSVFIGKAPVESEV